MKNLKSLIFIIAAVSFNTNAFDENLSISTFNNSSDVAIAATNGKLPLVKWEVAESKPTMSIAQAMKHAATIKALANATDEYLLFDGSSVSNPYTGSIYSATDAHKYMNGILRDSEAFYMKDGSKINLDQFFNNNGHQNIIDRSGLDRIKDGIIGIGIDHAVTGPGGLGGS
jgi:hypothetical protein